MCIYIHQDAYREKPCMSQAKLLLAAPLVCTYTPTHHKKQETRTQQKDMVAMASSVFAALDKDGDGKVSASELRVCMAAALGEEVSEEEAAAVVAAADADGDGLLDQEEFLRLAEAETEAAEEDRCRRLREAFGMYEMDGEGCITPASLKRMLGRLGAHREIEECRAMICRFDLDGDGVLSFDEFRVMMMV